MLRRTLVAIGCAALLAGFGAASAPARAAAASCPDPQYVLQAYLASHAWTQANTKGAGETIGVVGAPGPVGEAVCAAQALAPDATVVSGSASGASIVIVADSSVVAPSSGGRLVIEAAGDTSGPMPSRPPGVVNVAAADINSGAALPTSSYGPGILLAAFGTDTATASGYVGALAALLQAEHRGWTARGVAAQMAGSIGYLSGNASDDHLGFGVIEPDQAVSVDQIDPSTLPSRFADNYPATLPPGNTAPSTRSVPSSAASSGAPSSTAPSSAAQSGPSSAAGSASAPTASGPSGSAASPTPGGLTPAGPVNPFPSNQELSTGPSNGSHAAAAGGGGSGGFSPILLIGFVVLLAGGGYVFWQRRRQLEPAEVKPESEWEAPSGPRHSGYSPPDE